MKFMTFVRHSEKFREPGPPAALMEAMNEYVGKLIKDGIFVEGGGLRASKDGARVTLSGGKVTVKDGPFAESKEIVGGWAIINVASKAEAVRIETEFLELHRKLWPEFEGEAEIRPMFELGEGP